MKRFSFFIMGVFVTSLLYAQNLPRLIPPSPEATTFHMIKSPNIETYTGALKYSLPLFNIQSGSLSFPITLNYIDGNGVRIEEIASRVGLGWSLNMSGAVSRTIRDDPDDAGQGYLFNPPLVILTPANFLDLTHLYRANYYDTEPDLYSVSAPTLSSSQFYFKQNETGNYTENDIFKTQLNNSKITPIIENEKIQGFEVTDENGTTFLFNIQEKIKTSTTYGSDNRYKTTSWYLSEIRNTNGDMISFTYEPFTYFYGAMEPKSVAPSGPPEVYGVQYDYNAQRLSKITFDKGYIDVFYATAFREDFPMGEKSIVSLELKNNFGNLIKGVVFNQSYFNPDSSNPSDKRLKLDSLYFYTSLHEEKPYIFEYIETPNLPNRGSHARDHWGFFNGQTDNQSLEPHQIVINSNGNIKTYGDGDRSPSFTYGKSGVLNKIKYPLGGYSSFQFEKHIVKPVISYTELSTQETNFDGEYHFSSKDSINIASENYKTEVFFSANNIIKDNDIYYPYFLILGINKVVNPNNSEENSLLLENGKYNVSLTFYNSEGDSLEYDSNNPDPCVLNAKIQWTNVIHPDTTEIGGVRIKSVENYSSLETLVSKKEYDYRNDDGETSGKMVTRPVYLTHFRINADLNGSGNAMIIPVRSVVSNLPLLKTNGSFVGYEKVTVNEINIDNVSSSYKTDYYFSWEDFVCTASYFYNMYLNCRDFPLSIPINYGDYASGLLLFEKRYNSRNDLVYHKENKYSFFLPRTIPDTQPLLGIHILTRDAIQTYPYGGTSWADYYLEYGYIQKDKEIETLYDTDGHNPITTEKTFIYNDDNNLFLPSIIESTTSINNKFMITEFEYPYDLIGDEPYMQELVDANRIAQPIQTKILKNSELLSTQKTVYTDWGQNAQGTADIILPETIQSAKGDQDLEPRITYHKYDNHGNPLEVSKADSNAHIVYIWGYDHTKPIAKIDNATYSNIEDILGTDFEIVNYFSPTQENNLRSLPNAMITTYEYIPLVGVKTITQPNGEKIHYEYDNFNRLKFIKNSEGKILKENEYHYKN